jgi:glycosyltransferase involved in cell wall biosynthesis
MSIFPKVTVIIPAYNIRPYIEAALVSIEQQTLQAFEAIVVDDGSTDGTADVVQPFCQRDPRFRLVTKPNGGLSSARNYGIRQATTDYIALLDGDDVYTADKLANHVERLDRNPQVGVVYSASKVIRNDGQPTWMSLSGKPIFSDPLLSLLCKNFVGHGSNAVFRRVLIDEVGEFDETLRSSEDVDFWLRVAATEQWHFYREPRALSYYRVRPSGLSFNVAQMQYSHERVIQAAFQRSPQRIEPYLPTAYAHMYRFLARLSLTAGDAEQARQFIQQAWSSDRSIFYNDPRSLLTLVAVQLAPLAKQMIGRSLGSAKSISNRSL